jgi:hypothetical protein
VLAFPNNTTPLFLTLQSIDGYSGTFGQFTCAGLPAGAACSFSQSNVVLLPGGYAQVTFDLTTSSSSPAGNYAASVLSSNGEIFPAAPFTLNVGGFTLSANPSTVQIYGSNQPDMTITGSFSDFFNQTMTITCSGLPAGAACTGPGVIAPQSPSGTAVLSVQSGTPAQDYPFQVVATYENASTSVNATLRVSGFSATLQTNSATISSSQSAKFNIVLTSLNHFTNSQISIFCQSSSVVCATPNEFYSLTDGGTTTVTLTLGQQISASVVPFKSKQPWLAVAACFALLLFSPKRLLRWTRICLQTVVFFLLVSTICSCGGGGNGSGGGGGGSGSSQTYSVTVYASAITASGPLQVPAGTIALTVTQ